MFSRDLTREERSVRGSLVMGLSDGDVRRLDVFEGGVSIKPLQTRAQGLRECFVVIKEYRRKQVLVYPLGPPVALDDIESTVPPPIPPPNGLLSPLEVNTYVWCSYLSELHPTLWSFEEFVKENAWKWI